MEAGARGLFPHDLARDVIAADLRWRDPVAHERLHRRVHRHAVARVRATHGREHQQAVADLIFLHRGNPVASASGTGRRSGMSTATCSRPVTRTRSWR